MKKLCLLIFSVCIFSGVTSQNYALKLTNLNTNKEKVIKENKRIKLTTASGQELKGRFKIENESTISVDGVQINLADIEALKRNSILTATLTSGVLIYAGALAGGIAVIAGAFGNPSAFWAVLPAAGLIYTGIKSPNINKNHKSEKGWKFEIIPISD